MAPRAHRLDRIPQRDLGRRGQRKTILEDGFQSGSRWRVAHRQRRRIKTRRNTKSPDRLSIERHESVARLLQVDIKAELDGSIPQQSEH